MNRQRIFKHWNKVFNLMPILITVSTRKKIDMEGELWWNVLGINGQPISMKNSQDSESENKPD